MDTRASSKRGSSRQTKEQVFDLAIIGGGSAGCLALAGRVASTTKLQVALVEAGPDYGARTSGGWPADLVDGRCTPNSHDWGYEQTRVRVIGGCSVHNESALVLAQAGDYDRWGVPGWSDAELAPTIDYVAGLVPTRTCGDDGLAAWQARFGRGNCTGIRSHRKFKRSDPHWRRAIRTEHQGWNLLNGRIFLP